MKTSASPVSRHAPKGRLRRDGGLTAIFIGLAALAAACGGPGGSSIPGYVNGTPGSPLAFSQCMRAHGVPGFPDPPANGRWNLAGIDQNSPRFIHAAGICGSSGPGTGSGPSQQAEGLAKGLAFSRCMRAHGVRNYPDPTVRNGAIVEHFSGNGMDPESPAFQAAVRACRSVLRNGGGGS